MCIRDRLCFVLPTFTTGPEAQFSTTQLVFVAIVSLALYALFVTTQTLGSLVAAVPTAVYTFLMAMGCLLAGGCFVRRTRSRRVTIAARLQTRKAGRNRSTGRACDTTRCRPKDLPKC